MLALGTGPVPASPAPAPLLVSPAIGVTNVDPDPTLSWRWVDDLISNGSFETGMTPGWYVGGPNPTVWQVYASPTNHWATTVIPLSTRTTAQLIQDIYIPADAISATLQWKERVFNLIPSLLIGRLRVLLYENGGAMANLEDVTGSELVFQPPTWVTRSTNLLAYAGRSLQLVVQADTYSPNAVNSWYADVDAFSFSCQHSTTPEFQVYAGKSATLQATDQVGDTTALNFSSVVLDSVSTYYWRVAAVRDGVTNYSATSWFRTGQRALPQLIITGMTDLNLRLQFSTRTNRYYTVEQSDAVDGSALWFDATTTASGTGGPMEVEVALPSSSAVFWRLRISP